MGWGRLPYVRDVTHVRHTTLIIPGLSGRTRTFRHQGGDLIVSVFLELENRGGESRVGDLTPTVSLFLDSNRSQGGVLSL